MPIIYIETDNSDPQNKLFDASKAGAASAKAEAKMEKAVKGKFTKNKKAPDFTTEKKPDETPKGYFIRLKVAKVEVSGGQTKCNVKGEIVRFPKEKNAKGEIGEIMVSTNMTGNATATGTSPDSVADCVEAIAEDLAEKSMPFMRIDWAKR